MDKRRTWWMLFSIVGKLTRFGVPSLKRPALALLNFSDVALSKVPIAFSMAARTNRTLSESGSKADEVHSSKPTHPHENTSILFVHPVPKDNPSFVLRYKGE